MLDDDEVEVDEVEEEADDEQLMFEPSDIADDISSMMRTMVSGAAEDLDRFAEEISVNMTEAAFLGRGDLIDELTNQLKAIGEKHRLVAVGGSWQVATTVVRGVARILVTAVAAL